MKIVIKGRLPGLNEYIAAERTNRHAAAKMKREAQALVMLQVRRQIRRPLAEPVYMCYLWVEPNRKRDKSNICGFGRKVIEDALVKCGALKNDGWADIAGFADDFAVDKGYPRIEIDIQEDYQCTG